MTARTGWTLAAIALVVAGLSAYRSAGRVDPGPPAAPPPAAPAASAVSAPTPPSAAKPPAAALPRVLDFGRDT